MYVHSCSQNSRIAIGRLVANVCQWTMTLYGATVDVAVLSPHIILSLGTIIFIDGNIDITIEIYLRKRGN
jgi:hypothetical protein